MSRIGVLAMALLATVACCQIAVAQDSDLPPLAFASLAERLETSISPLLARYCGNCHGQDRSEADIEFDTIAGATEFRRHTKIWQQTRDMLESGQMPPEEELQLNDVEKELLLGWVMEYLKAESQSRAGDPGRVVLRRLSNAEYTYTVRDLTGLDQLDPAREFPVDGAAGEGFTNVGDGLVMSPALVSKYLNAAKDISQHLVLLPDGITFSAYRTRRDWTDQWLSRIQAIYRRYSDDSGSTSVDLQGIKFDTNQGGRLPIGKYLAAIIAHRSELDSGSLSYSKLADSQRLSAKYLETLHHVLSHSSGANSNGLLSELQRRMQRVDQDGMDSIVQWIHGWQSALWKFNAIGQAGRQGGAEKWMQPVTPLVTRRDLELTLPETASGDEMVFYLTINDSGGLGTNALVTISDLRLEGKGMPVLPLRDAAGLSNQLQRLRSVMLANTSSYLAAADEFQTMRLPLDELANVAQRHQVDPLLLRIWIKYLAFVGESATDVEGHYATQERGVGGYDFISGWGSGATPLVFANASDQDVRIPGFARAHSVVVHPSPTQFTAVGWQSPINGLVEVQAEVADAHPECGNGVAFALQHHTQVGIENLWLGEFGQGGTATSPGQVMNVQKGQLISLAIGPRQGNHTCDLTQIKLTITQSGGAEHRWNLSADVTSDILAGNPHADQYGSESTWHFYQGEMSALYQAIDHSRRIPPDSRLARWLATTDSPQRSTIAKEIQRWVVAPLGSDWTDADVSLYQQIRSLPIPLDHPRLADPPADPRFGHHPASRAVDANDLVIRAPAVIPFRVSAELAKGRRVLASAQLDPQSETTGCVQVRILSDRQETNTVSATEPLLVSMGNTQHQVAEAIDQFRNLFPAAVCYDRIVPVDEVVTLRLFFREDEHFKRLLLPAEESAELDRCWEELFYVSQEPLQLAVSYEQLVEFATQDRPDLVEALGPMRGPINQRATEFRAKMVADQPRQLEALIELADRAWRRPLSRSERAGLRQLYTTLRDQEIEHEEALRLVMARILTSPDFLYRLESQPSGQAPARVSDWELATRLSYFLWSSLPDAQLAELARDGQLSDPDLLVAQTRRMLRSGPTDRLARQFACQWLHVRQFAEDVEKNEQLFPKFADLRAGMSEETVRFFEDLFRNNGSILEIITADHTFLNESLSQHYGIGGVQGDHWRRVDDLGRWHRGGILAMASVLASQSGASRTSPILRGNWVYETLLGEKLPRPPAGVPQLPEQVAPGHTARELIEQHSRDQACAKCHAKIDPFGFALEQYDTVGRLRPGSVETNTRLPDGTTIEGLPGLRKYLSETRRTDLVRQFCRKLLGYALGREIDLSDEQLLDQMQSKLQQNGYRFHDAVEVVVTSDAFRMIRGRDFVEP